MNLRAFTLIELLVVIAIIAILAAIASPAIGPVIERGRSAKCVGNLRQIGVAVQSYVADNDNYFPSVQTEPPSAPPESNPGTAIEKLGPYGVTDSTLICPSDEATLKNFQNHGTSYRFLPVLQDERQGAVKLYSSRGIFLIQNTGRIRVCEDYGQVHSSRPIGKNLLRADGRVEQH